MSSPAEPSSLIVGREMAGRLLQSPSAIVAIGGFDGSRNFGDVLQFLGAIRLFEESGTNVPFVAVIEWQYRDGYLALADKSEALRCIDVAYFCDGDMPGDLTDDQLVILDRLPRRTLVYFYGGGYANRMWGQRKADMFDAARRLVGGGVAADDIDVRVVARGLQLDPGGGALIPILALAKSVGTRDNQSQEFAESTFGDAATFSGDDAVSQLVKINGETRGGSEVARAINVHVSLEPYVTADADARRSTMLQLVNSLCASLEPDQINLIVAFADDRIGESRVAAEMAEEFRGLGRAFCPSVAIVDPLGRLLGGDRPLPPAIACVASSYHIGLASLTDEVPTIFLHDGVYYGQKAEGLSRLFGLPPELFIGSGDPIDGTVRMCVDLVNSAVARARYQAGGRAGIVASLLGHARSDRAILREIHDLEAGAGREQLARLGREYAAAAHEVSELRLRNADLLRAARGLAALYRAD